LSDERTLARKGSPELGSWVSEQTCGYESTLEFGCGLGSYTRFIASPVKDGIEAFGPYVVTAQADSDNAGCRFYLGDMRRFYDLVDRQYDVALFIDSLEHLAKDEGADLLLRCQESFKKIAVMVPVGPCVNEPCDGNDLQRHLSTWYAEDLIALGFVAKVDEQLCAYATWCNLEL